MTSLAYQHVCSIVRSGILGRRELLGVLAVTIAEAVKLDGGDADEAGIERVLRGAYAELRKGMEVN